MYNNNNDDNDNGNYHQLSDISKAQNNNVSQNQNEASFDYPESSQIQNQQPQEMVKNNSSHNNQDQELQVKQQPVHQTNMGENNNMSYDQQGYQAPYFNNDTGLISDTEQGNQQLQMSSLKIEGCNLFQKDTFHSKIASQLQEINPTFGPLQILTDQRIQSIKQSFIYLRKLGGGQFIASALLCFIMIILYFCTFKYYGYWFLKTWMVLAMAVWVLQVVLFGYSCYITSQQYLKISFLFNCAVMINFLIFFFVIAGKIPGGYIFMIVVQLLAQGGHLYGVFLMNQEMEKMQKHIDSQK